MTRTLSEIAERLALVYDGPDVPIRRPSLVDDAGPGALTLATTPAFAARAAERGAAALLTTPDMPAESAAGLPRLLAENPRLAFARVLELFDESAAVAPGIHPSAVIDESACVDPSASIGPFTVIERGATVGARSVLGAGCFIGAEARIGADARLGPRVTVHHRCTLGERVRVQTGSVIGSEGFGYEWDGTRHVRVPHIGIVILEDDVEVGANCAIDRAKTGATVIGQGTKIDNLVQIGHNVRTGPHCILVSQVGVSGSVVLEPGVVLAGQAGVADNVTIGAGTVVSAQAGVTGSLPPGKVVMGFPARDADEMRRILAAEGRLPDLVRRVRALERAIERASAGEPGADAHPGADDRRAG